MCLLNLPIFMSVISPTYCFNSFLINSEFISTLNFVFSLSSICLSSAIFCLFIIILPNRRACIPLNISGSFRVLCFCSFLPLSLKQLVPLSFHCHVPCKYLSLFQESTQVITLPKPFLLPQYRN